MQKTYSPRGKKSYSSRPHHRKRGGSRGGARKQFINPQRFINLETKEEKVVEYTPINSFKDFGLNSKLLETVTKLNYETPSAIQDQTIPLAIDGKDVVGLANTGTGKTAAFLLPIIDKLYANRTTGSVLIMAPTRELAQQIDAEFRRFTWGMKLYSTLVVGGANMQQQIRSLMRKPHVVIGTPGRMKDLIGRRQLHLHDVTTFVLDEADRMLDMGFVHDIREIASELPLKHQTLCFSATITPAVEKIVQDFMNSPITVSVKTSETNDHIRQDVVVYRDNDHKKDLLLEMLRHERVEKAIIFGETKFGVQRLSDHLSKDGLSCVAIHGNKSQSQRERALRQFKQPQTKVLVATDVAARGLDIPGVSHVINYDTPQSYEDYVHRIGRTGRAGKTGEAFTFVKNTSTTR